MYYITYTNEKTGESKTYTHKKERNLTLPLQRKLWDNGFRNKETIYIPDELIKFLEKRA